MGEEICKQLQTDGVMAEEKSLINEAKRSNEWVVDASELETQKKKPAKEISNDEQNSEVLDPNNTPQGNVSTSQTATSEPTSEPASEPMELTVRSECGDVACTSTGNSSTEVTDSEEDQCIDDDGDMYIRKVLEDEKSSNSSGIRRIVFKLRKRTGDENRFLDVYGDKGTSYSRFHGGDEMFPSVGTSGAVFGGSEPYVIKNQMRFKMSKKVTVHSFLTSVTKLLMTGILDGAKVKYTKTEDELLGIITTGGYLCGCAQCNFTMVVNAHEFEQHAGCKTRHPNDHIFLDNGRSVYSIVQELRDTPLGFLDQVIRPVAGSSVNEEAYLVWKGSFESANIQQNRMGGKYKHRRPQLLTSCPSEVLEDSLRPVSSSLAWKFSSRQENYMEEDSIDHNWLPKKARKPSQVFRPNSCTFKQKSVRGKKRDNDLHRAIFMPNGLPDGAELAYYSKGKRLLEGYKQGNGIVCSCCNSEISPSSFEAHAGWSTRRQPYRHIYTSDGVSLHDLSLSLASGQSLATTGGGRHLMCTVCGDGGNLILCDGCPRAFHSVCLGSQCLPEGDLYCPYCRDKSVLGANESCGNVKLITIRLTRVVKAPAPAIGGCVVCRAHDFSVAKFDDRTVMLCDQCEKEYHVGCLRDCGLGQLNELPKGKWFCREECSRIHAALQNLILTGPEVIPASLSNPINRKLTQRGLTEEVGDVRWQLLSGKTGLSAYRSLLSRAAAIFRGCFDPIVERSGRDLIPAMVYGKNVAGLEFGGMYCAVLSVKSVIVSAGILRIFGKDAAEIPLVATIKGRQGMGCFQALFTCMENFLCGLNVKNLVLPAAEEAISIWTNKFGFRQMTDESFFQYTKDYQLMTFKGTSMLEKALPPGKMEEL